MEKSEERSWSPAYSQLYTQWTGKVNPDLPHPEYPRPQLVRDEWLNLNGLWDYAIASRNSTRVEQYEGRILVPYPIESALSGIGRALSHKDQLVYRRFITIPENWIEKRIILHFGGVDWEARVFLNGRDVGTHRGGYVPFSLDITDYLEMEQQNTLQVWVWDPTDKGKQERGKQSLRPKAIVYTAVSGIWQTVWLEPVPEAHIQRLKLTPNLDESKLEVEATIAGPTRNVSLEVKIIDPSDNAVISKEEGELNLESSIPNPRLWSPETPFLYDLHISLLIDGQPTDVVRSYFGMRKISIGMDDSGVQRIRLNNQPVFHYGPLDHGYWPDGLYTAATDDALRYDVELMKELGFNMVRKHVKVESARWYYHCDKLGMLVWQDMPNGGTLSLLTYKYELQQGRGDPENRMQFMNELEEMIYTLRNHPSIVMWIPFNEGWGQFETEGVVQRVRELDSTRLINEASGWFDKGTGDIADIHKYPGPAMPHTEEERAAVLGEFGGLKLLLPEHTWHPGRMFGFIKYYHGFLESENATELTEKYIGLLDSLQRMIPEGLAAAVYTQLTDVEGEVNGYITYDRKILKMEKERIIDAHERLIGML